MQFVQFLEVVLCNHDYRMLTCLLPIIHMYVYNQSTFLCLRRYRNSYLLVISMYVYYMYICIYYCMYVLYVCICKLLCMIRFLIVCICIQGGWTPLHGAASQDHCEIVKLLLSKGAEVNIKDSVSTQNASISCIWYILKYIPG